MIRFFNLKKKNNFIGANALEKIIQSGVDIKIVYLEVEVNDVDARGNEPVYHNNKVVGVVTSGGYGFRAKKSLAFAYVKSDVAEASNLEVEIQGTKRRAKILHKVVYDPDNKKLTA
jgi:dimethylglycine dehydrogenase